jgi:hypothetical protein
MGVGGTTKLIGLAAILAAAALAPTASASSIVGADLTQTPDDPGGSCLSPGNPCSRVTVTKSSTAPETGSSTAGVLTSARVRTRGGATTVMVRVLKPDPVLALTFLNVGPEIPIPVSADAVLSGHVSEATGLHHPIEIGDRLGIGYVDPATSLVAGSNFPAGAVCAFQPVGGHAVNTSQQYSTAACFAEVLVQGTVEPDADRDGFGDETQDGCPTNPAALAPPCSPPAACGIPPGATSNPCIPNKQKCERKKKARSAAAKSKRCKKKRKK